MTHNCKDPPGVLDNVTNWVEILSYTRPFVEDPIVGLSQIFEPIELFNAQSTDLILGENNDR
jgi:hypothetical protein